MFDLNGKVAIITGGASGIGLEISRIFAKANATVHIFELNIDLAEREADLINIAGGKAFCHKVDVSNQSEVQRKVSKILSIHPVDILVNNAGIAHIGNVENTTEEDMLRLFNVNVMGFYNCIKALIPAMKSRGGGSIINMASVAASVGIEERFAYSMTKGAILSMTIQVAKDYVKHNIRCNSISPARVQTPFVENFVKKHYAGKEVEMMDKLAKSQPIGRMAKPSEIASFALYLASDQAAFLTGTDYSIDGGFIKLNSK
ncbi:MAG: SDR family NAD(P)-dependent oxidoreductase [Leadbetterella sp.]